MTSGNPWLDLIILKAVESWNASQDAQARGASGRQFGSLSRAQKCFDTWREVYIMIGLMKDCRTKFLRSRYQVSDREFRSKIAPYEYSSRFETRAQSRW